LFLPWLLPILLILIILGVIYIDEVNKEYIKGWTYDPNDISQPIYVEIQMMEMQVVNSDTPNPTVTSRKELLKTTVFADQSRPDMGSWFYFSYPSFE